jgi:heptosyltransferase II
MPRLLLVKLGAIGDVVMAIPGAYAMHLKGYEVDWVCGNVAVPVLQLYPWINVIAVDEKKLLHSGKVTSLRAMAALWRKLGGREYDICATLYYDARYRLLTLPLRARRKVILTKDNRATQLLAGRHHTDEYARILLAQIPEEYANGETPSQLAPIRAKGLTPSPRSEGKTRIVLVPAGARNAMRDDGLRRWPAENYAELAAALTARGYEVILAGGPDDGWVSSFFDSISVTNLIGKCSLTETMGLLDSAEVTVTHDTGPLHLAGITGTAVVAIFGPTDPRGRLPQRSNCVALWGGEGFACRPCYDGRDYAPCEHNGCMHQITPAMVFGEVETLLTARREGRDLLPRVRTPKHTPVPALIRIEGTNV